MLNFESSRPILHVSCRNSRTFRRPIKERFKNVARTIRRLNFADFNDSLKAVNVIQRWLTEVQAAKSAENISPRHGAAPTPDPVSEDESKNLLQALHSVRIHNYTLIYDITRIRLKSFYVKEKIAHLTEDDC